MNLLQRKKPRLKEYDYAQEGAYFITICTKNREFSFGGIVAGEMQLNKAGDIVREEIGDLSARYDVVEIDEFVVMPNHVHMIVKIVSLEKETERINPFPTIDIPNIVGKFKAGVTRKCRERIYAFRKQAIWQKSYHDHIIRNQKIYCLVTEYIKNNPRQWELDCHNPQNSKYKKWGG